MGFKPISELSTTNGGRVQPCWKRVKQFRHWFHWCLNV